MNLSEQQTKAFDAIMMWFRSPAKRFVLAGYAGAGKTTLARYIEEAIGGTIFCAYTGKAANVLREKGCENVGTIHGFLYQPKKQRAEDSEVKFGYAPKAAWLEARLIIVDEYSMLPEKLIEDIEREGRKILYLGDPFQLPPVKGDCTLQPDFFLTDIHRQALESSIIRFSKCVREGESIPYGDHGDLRYLRQRETAPEMYTGVDQIIVGKNDTRQAWNTKFRKLLGFARSSLPVRGDKIICLKNNHEIGLFNGMIGLANNNCALNGIIYGLDFEGLRGIPVWKGDVMGEGANFKHGEKQFKGLERFDFAYAITCHKSQGSEFNTVLVYNQPIGGDAVERRRWAYTAITRGKKLVTLVEPA